MDAHEMESHAEQLYTAWRNRTTLTPLRERSPSITIEDAYRIQERYIARRLDAGEKIVGKKIGVTSRVVQEMLNVFQPDFGQLTSGMVRTQEQGVDLGELIQPKAEAELAFVLKSDLRGPGVTVADVIRATDYVSPCLEIVDSRIENWRIAIQDTVADNASCGVYVVGDQRGDPRKLDLTLSGLIFERNGELVSTGAGAAVQGSPAHAVAWLANTLGALGIPFLAGEVILSGSQSALLPIQSGDELTCTIAGLGSCRARFSGKAAV